MAFRNNPARRAVTCNMCGQQFFPASLKFHQKACAKKQATKLVPCPYCDGEWRRNELQHHMANCRARPYDAPAPAPARAASRKGSRRGSRRATRTRFADEEETPIQASHAPVEGVGVMTADGRMPCPVCGRKFNVDRLAKHQTICRKISSHQAQRKVFNAAKHRMTAEAKAVARSAPEPARKRPKPQRSSLRSRMAAQRGGGGGGRAQPRFQTTVSPVKPAGGGGGGAGAGARGAKSAKWRADSNALRDAMRRNRQFSKLQASGAEFGDLGPTMPDPDQHRGLTPCPHCGRTFNAQAAARHIPSCAHVINKPKPPPTNLSVRSGPGSSRRIKSAARSRSRGGSRQAQRGPSPYGQAQQYGEPQRRMSPSHRRQREAGWDHAHHTGGPAYTSGRASAPRARAEPRAGVDGWVGATSSTAMNPYIGKMVGRSTRIAKGVREITGRNKAANRRGGDRRRASTSAGFRGGAGSTRRVSSTSVRRIPQSARPRAVSRGRSRAPAYSAGASPGGFGGGGGGLRATQASSIGNPLVTSSYQTAPHERPLDPRLSVTRQARPGAMRHTQATSRDNPLATSTYQVMDHERPLDPRLSVTRQARPGATRNTQATSLDNPLATSTYQVMDHERPLDPRLSVTRQARPGAVRHTQATSASNPLATSSYQTMDHERPLDPRLSVTRQARPGAVRMTQATSSGNPLATSSYQTMPHEHLPHVRFAR